MRGYKDLTNLPTNYKVKDPRPVKREPYKPEGNAARDGFTRGPRHAPWGAPGDFATEAEADRYNSMIGGLPAEPDSDD